MPFLKLSTHIPPPPRPPKHQKIYAIPQATPPPPTSKASPTKSMPFFKLSTQIPPSPDSPNPADVHTFPHLWASLAKSMPFFKLSTHITPSPDSPDHTDAHAVPAKDHLQNLCHCSSYPHTYPLPWPPPQPLWHPHCPSPPRITYKIYAIPQMQAQERAVGNVGCDELLRLLGHAVGPAQVLVQFNVLFLNRKCCWGTGKRQHRVVWWWVPVEKQQPPWHRLIKAKVGCETSNFRLTEV